jgi:AcrR family transcriptional regulator
MAQCPRVRNRTASAKKPPATTRGEHRMAQVLEAAVDLFHERGYASTSIEDVAQAVGLLKGSLYYYIQSKEDLLFRIVDEVHADVQETMDEAFADTTAPPLERITRFTRRQVEYNARNVKRIAVYHHDWQLLQGERLADVRGRRRDQAQAVVAVLEEARSRGDVPADLDPQLAARCAFAAIIWPYTWYRPGSVSPERLAEFCAQFVLGGLTGPRA